MQFVAQVAGSADPLELMRQSLGKLASSATVAAQDMRTALSTRERLLKTKTKRSLEPGAATEPAAKKGPGVSPRWPIFEYGPCYGQQLPNFATEACLTTALIGGGAPKLDTSLPFKVSDYKTAAARVSTHSAIKAARGAFRPVWRASPLRGNPGRAMLRFSAPASVIAAKALRESLVSCMLNVDEHEALSALLAPGLFAVAAGSAAAFSERCGMPSLRVASSGLRLIIMMPAAAARAYMRVGGADASDSMVLKLSQSMLNLTQDEVADAASRFTIYWSYTGPGQLLYTPANWITCEEACECKQVQDVRASGVWQSGTTAATSRAVMSPESNA